MSTQYDSIRGAISKLIKNELGQYEWDDTVSVRCTDRAAEALRIIACEVPHLFPPANPKEYCSKKGMEFFGLLLQATET